MKKAAATVRVTLQRPPADGTTATTSIRSRAARVSVGGSSWACRRCASPICHRAHQFQFELTGHKTVTSTVNIVAGERARVTVTLVEGDR